MTRTAAALVLAALVVTGARSASAHEVRPGYLQVRQTGLETFAILWKVPARSDSRRLRLSVVLPTSCKHIAPVGRYLTPGAYTERWTVRCTGGLVGQQIEIEGLKATLTDVLVRVEWADGMTQVVRLIPAAPAFFVEAAPSKLEVARTYLQLGVEHILLGLDHLLFVLALLILVEGRRRLIATVTAFTVAHSITLAAATLGLVRLSQGPVEAVIALSIMYAAGEIVHHKQGRPGLTKQWPWVVAFIFGLLHGFGFAGALREVGLPEQAIPLALLFFNVGVEVGQLLFVAGVLVLAALAPRIPFRPPAWAWRVPAYGIGGLAAFWTVERVVEVLL